MSQSCSLVEEMLVCTVKKMHCCMCLQNRVGVELTTMLQKTCIKLYLLTNTKWTYHVIKKNFDTYFNRTIIPEANYIKTY